MCGRKKYGGRRVGRSEEKASRSSVWDDMGAHKEGDEKKT